jgi:formylglycine-generating enzyme required for sulfatase activity
MVVVPAGSFTMGSPESEPERLDNEGPQHTVTISQPFAVGKWTVTVDQYAAFVGDRGAKPSRVIQLVGSDPVVEVTWEEAKAYAAWAPVPPLRWPASGTARRRRPPAEYYSARREL